MLHTTGFLLASIVRLFRTRRNLWLENLALRQQLVILNRKHPRPGLTVVDKLFWVLVRGVWSKWKQALIVVSPEADVRWHRAGFRFYWTWLSRHQISSGRTRISKELRELIFKMVAENPTWVRPASTESCKCLAWMSRAAPYRAAYSGHRGTPKL